MVPSSSGDGTVNLNQLTKVDNAMPEQKYIKKIKLSDGAVYYVYDVNAPRKADLDNYLPVSGGSITGNLDVDQQLVAGTLKVDSIEYHATKTDNVLVQAADGTIKKRSADKLLEDIGGFSCNVDKSKGILTFKLGK